MGHHSLRLVPSETAPKQLDGSWKRRPAFGEWNGTIQQRLLNFVEGHPI
jgi:hypothetical protein